MVEKFCLVKRIRFNRMRILIARNHEVWVSDPQARVSGIESSFDRPELGAAAERGAAMLIGFAPTERACARLGPQPFHQEVDETAHA